MNDIYYYAEKVKKNKIVKTARPMTNLIISDNEYDVWM